MSEILGDNNFFFVFLGLVEIKKQTFYSTEIKVTS